jgi:hypothetical protein
MPTTSTTTTDAPATGIYASLAGLYDWIAGLSFPDFRAMFTGGKNKNLGKQVVRKGV